MARTFTGSNHIDFSPGAVTDSSLANRTFATIMRLTTDVVSDNDSLIVLNESTDGNGTLFIGAGGTLGMCHTAFAQVATSTFVTTAANGYVLLAGTKVSGTATPRFHQYIYGTNVWTHQNGNQGIVGDGAGATTTCELGAFFGTFDPLDGDIAVAAVFPTVLTDDQTELLAHSLMAWHSFTPEALWVLDQSSITQKVVDLTGGGADESAISGTTVATTSVPGFTYGADVMGIHSVPTTGLPPDVEGPENSSTMYSRGFGKG